MQLLFSIRLLFNSKNLLVCFSLLGAIYVFLPERNTKFYLHPLREKIIKENVRLSILVFE